MDWYIRGDIFNSGRICWLSEVFIESIGLTPISIRTVLSISRARS